ncbi:MAG TPA: methyltransferase [Acetobacteraceae bacterium]|nr:methyltransferase [Acetobacteraceae bacterium]
MSDDPDWRRLNRANWDERVAVHLGPGGYDLRDLRAGRGRLRIVEGELGPVDGLRMLHLQCHVGHDTLALVQRGATVVGLDFSPAAIAAASQLADELGLADRAHFVLSDVYDAPAAIPEPMSFDCVFATWGTIPWLPDIGGWARVVVHFLKPGGFFYFAEGHPLALVLDDAAVDGKGRPAFALPYFGCEPFVATDPRDYADPTARLTNATTHQWLHPLGDVISALIGAGLRLDWLHEHSVVPWRMFDCLVPDDEELYRWPDKPWLPLAYSLRATRPV